VSVHGIPPGVTVLARRFCRLIHVVSTLCPTSTGISRRIGAVTQFLCGIIIWTNRPLIVFT
jgi:hypothetical protein